MRIDKHHRFMWKYSKGLLLKIIERPAFLFLGLLTLTILTVFSFIMYALEHESNPAFATLFDSAFFTVSTMTSVGMASANPSTTPGKLVTMAMMLLGTFLFVSFTGVVASTVLELELDMKEHQRHESRKKQDA